MSLILELWYCFKYANKWTGQCICTALMIYLQFSSTERIALLSVPESEPNNQTESQITKQKHFTLKLKLETGFCYAWHEKWKITVKGLFQFNKKKSGQVIQQLQAHYYAISGNYNHLVNVITTQKVSKGYCY